MIMWVEPSCKDIGEIPYTFYAVFEMMKRHYGAEEALKATVGYVNGHFHCGVEMDAETVNGYILCFAKYNIGEEQECSTPVFSSVYRLAEYLEKRIEEKK